ncbi:hypothetical protein VB773_18680 [Haloarculaceae archaeon H-GB2-1]|nr:hypothetical protein [Haloarculaceae archaeon H-GB1-1]MEA5387901.1 hypothetical protein [Haloarculaceae archaeon H-GB11]MEA5409396.1 hypothetical protein [Haloarculaceae archaeon H-GB2-1]
MVDESNPDKPDWWVENEQIRESMGLPEYDPARFEDDVYVHEVIDDLEGEYDCSIQIIGLDTDYLDDREVRVDGETAFTIGRRRTDHGNTVYQIPSEQFASRVKQAVSNR